ncbi:probable disease resistance protein At5g66900 [Ziziphus jujuba]|uniref:Probable disease resistance protein At5g66900 n=1 Tax=Ziziphus jujuba TaxID=326968 RepID=A0ABM4AEM4_ZIZJJ|nr:probable disease resistance protein At5g66900 [Ziziphus jujuba]
MVLDFGGAALGAAFGVLFDVVIEIKNKNLMFKPILKKLKSTLESLKPLITVIEKYNKKLDLPEGETTDFKLKMEKGAELVRKCSKVNRFNIFIKFYLAGKLTELDDTLKRLIEILEAQGVRDVKENLTLTREIYLDVKENLTLTREIHSKVDGGGSNNGLVHNQINVPAISSCDVLDQLPSLTVGLEKPLKELKMRLLNNGAPLLVVNGRGGVGKTLLARRFCLDDEVKEKFKSNIFFVVVSKTQPTVSSIVQRLHKHTGNEVPDLPDEAVAVRYLKQLLNKLSPSPILLVLDDVWPGSVSLVRNFVVQIPEYKILVTSRSQLPGFGPPDFAPPYHLEPLNDGDAMTLFRFWACLEDWSSHIPYDIVKKIVDHYNVSPLALKIVAGSLSGQPTEIWRRRLKECSNGSPTLSSETELDTHLQSYLDDLKISEKECFMDLGSFPEDQRISVVSLIDMWTEFYELEEDGDAVINLIDLDLRNLANLVVTRKDVNADDDYYSEHFATQHDLLRDLAIHQSIQDPVGQRKRLIMNLRGDNLPKWWKEHEQQPFKAHLLSISTDETFSSKWFDMQLPEAKILVLNFRTKDYALPKFVENMGQLKVLIVTNYSSFHAEVGNFQLLGSLNNMKRIRLERISIPTPSKTPVKLENLQKISLFMCSIGDAFSNCSIKLSEFLPNLKEMNIDFCDDLVKLPVEFCDSNCMKKLSITYCPKLSELPDGIGDMVNLEVLRLRSCIRLQGLPGSIGNLSNLTFLDICDCVSIENLPDRVGELHNLRKLNMTNCSKLQDLPESLKELEQLKVLICDDNGKQLWESSLPHRNDVDIRLTIKDINLNWMPGFG